MTSLDDSRTPSEARLKGSSSTKRQNEKTISDGGWWGWLVVFASFMLHFVNDGVSLSLGELFEELLLKYGASNGATSSILSIIIGTSLCTGPISSVLVNVYGCRAVTIIGTLIAAAFIVVSAYATNITTLVFTLGLGAGFGFGLSYLPALVCITYYFDRYRSLATGIAVCGSGFGTMIFSSFFKVSLHTFKIDHIFLIIAAIVLTSIVFSLFFRQLPNNDDSTSAIPPQQSDQVNPEVIRLTINPEECLEVRSKCEKEHNVSNDSSNKARESVDKSNSKMISTTKIGLAEDGIMDIEKQKKRVLYTEFENMLNDMTDFAFMKDPVFVIFVLSNFFTSVGFDIPYVFVPIKSKEKGIDQQLPGSLISAIGAGNIIGRVMLTYICDYFSLNRLNFYSTCLTLCGIVTIVGIYCYDIISFGIICALYGLLISTYISFTLVLTTDLFGIDKVTNALGITLLFQGIAAFIGPPIAGIMCDYFQTHDPAFYFSGLTVSMSGIILYFIPLLKQYCNKREISA